MSSKRGAWISRRGQMPCLPERPPSKPLTRQNRRSLCCVVRSHATHFQMMVRNVRAATSILVGGTACFGSLRHARIIGDIRSRQPGASERIAARSASLPARSWLDDLTYPGWFEAPNPDP
jgi:hypothetical protein